MERVSEVLRDKTEYSKYTEKLSQHKGTLLICLRNSFQLPTDLCLELTWEIGPVFSAVGEAKMANTRSQPTASS